MPLETTPPKLNRVARVLVVDDDAINLTVASQFCIMFGADVDCAAGGAQAVESCGQSAYDLVLMDIRMPRVDGFEATVSIRRLGGWAASVPIIAVTADIGPGLTARCLSIGISAIAAKPIRMRELFEKMQAALDGDAQSLAAGHYEPALRFRAS